LQNYGFDRIISNMIAGPENSKFASEREKMVYYDMEGRGITEARCFRLALISFSRNV
jgi:hypothetical protein